MKGFSDPIPPVYSEQANLFAHGNLSTQIQAFYTLVGNLLGVVTADQGTSNPNRQIVQAADASRRLKQLGDLRDSATIGRYQRCDENLSNRFEV